MNSYPFLKPEDQGREHGIVGLLKTGRCGFQTLPFISPASYLASPSCHFLIFQVGMIVFHASCSVFMDYLLFARPCAVGCGGQSGRGCPPRELQSPGALCGRAG